MVAPAGFATVFAGWNVWDVGVADELEKEVLMLGVSPERRLRIFCEESAQDGPGVDVAEPLNPLELKGSQVEIIDNAADLQPFETAEVQKPGANLVLAEPSHVETVRFFNKGRQSVITWPRSFPVTRNFLLQTVYQPTLDSPLTKNPPSKSAADKIADLFSNAGMVALLAGVAYVYWQGKKTSGRF